MKLPRRNFLHLCVRVAALPAFAILISAAIVAVWATVAQAQTEKYDLQERCGKFAAEVFAKEWGTGFSCAGRGKHVDLPAYQIGSLRRQSIVLALCPTVLYHHVLALDVASLLQPLAKCGDLGCPIFG
jgi:hypothetical protein